VERHYLIAGLSILVGLVLAACIVAFVEFWIAEREIRRKYRRKRP
jgi:hypothetical protein